MKNRIQILSSKKNPEKDPNLKKNMIRICPFYKSKSGFDHLKKKLDPDTNFIQILILPKYPDLDPNLSGYNVTNITIHDGS